MESTRPTLERVYPDTSKTIVLKEIIISFLEEHKSTKFTFKCSKCHRAEFKTEDSQLSEINA